MKLYLRLFFTVTLFIMFNCCTSETQDEVDKNKYVIELKVTKDQLVFLRNKQIPAEEIAKNIIKIKEGLGKEEHAFLSIRLIVEKNVKMGLLLTVRNQLKKTDILKIEYVKK